MRNWALWNPPHVRCSLALLITLFSLAVSGCGGGGGGGNPPGGGGGGGGGTTLTGVVRDQATNQGIQGATVSIVGTNLQTQTDRDGNFNLPGVPANATRFLVTSPDTTQWLNTAFYNTVQFGTDPNSGQRCSLPLPALGGGNVALPSSVLLASANTPPPPPVGGCPP